MGCFFASAMSSLSILRCSCGCDIVTADCTVSASVTFDCNMNLSLKALITTATFGRYPDCSPWTDTTLADAAFRHPDTPIPKTTWDSESPVPTPHHRGRWV